MTNCRTCDTTWHGLTECHCVAEGCHRHFGSVAAFDAHRVGLTDTRRCADPETLTTRSGRKPLQAVLRGSRTVWIANDSRGPRRNRLPKVAATGTAHEVAP